MITVKVEGLAEVEKQLERLSKSAGKAVLRRVLRREAEPMAIKAASLAPVGKMADLASSISVGTKLSKRQASMHRKMFRDDRASVEMFVGPGPDPAAWNQEFGNINHGPQAFMRPAFDSEVRPMLDRLSKALWEEVQKTIARAERRAARAG